MNLGATFVLQQDAAQAYRHLQQSRQYYEQVQSKDFLAETLRYLAEAALLDGDFAQADSWVKEAIALAVELEMAVDVACCRCVLGQIFWAQGDFINAEVALRESVAQLLTLSDEYQLARSRYWLARLLVTTGGLAEAKMLLSQAKETFAHLDAAKDLVAVQTLQREHSLI